MVYAISAGESIHDPGAVTKGLLEDLGWTEGTVSSVYYVDPSGTCAGNTPCSTTVQGAVNASSTGTVVKITGGSFGEDLSLDADKDLVLEGGYNSEFSSQSSETVLRSMALSNGRAVVDRLVLGTGGASSEAASVVFLNMLGCGDPLVAFSASFTVGGHELTSTYPDWSSCVTVPCGESVSWSLYADAGACGTISQSGSMNFDCNALYKITLQLNESDEPTLYYVKVDSADCSDAPSATSGQKTLMNPKVLSTEGGPSGFTVFEPGEAE